LPRYEAGTTPPRYLEVSKDEEDFESQKSQTLEIEMRYYISAVATHPRNFGKLLRTPSPLMRTLGRHCKSRVTTPSGLHFRSSHRNPRKVKCYFTISLHNMRLVTNVFIVQGAYVPSYLSFTQLPISNNKLSKHLKQGTEPAQDTDSQPHCPP
jgi:hypothetical protein